MAAAYNAILADDRPINVRPWLYRIARNRSLNHLRRIQPLGMDSMDVHLHDHGATTADLVHDREEFRLLVVDIQRLPESQRTALVLREMDALSYEQIAEAMETTVPSVKSLLVRARIGLAEAAEARLLSCDAVRIELGEVAEGLQRKPGPLVRRHLKTCARCATFEGHLKETSRSLAVLLPIGPLVLLRKLAMLHLGHSAGSGAGAAASSSAGAGAAAGSGAGAAAGGAGAAAAGAGMSSAGGLVSAGVAALAGKAAVGIAAAALVTAGAVEVDHSAQRQPAVTPPVATFTGAGSGGAAIAASHLTRLPAKPAPAVKPKHAKAKVTPAATAATTTATTPITTTPTTTTPTTPASTGTTTTTTVTTVLPASGSGSGTSSDGTGGASTGGSSSSGGASPGGSGSQSGGSGTGDGSGTGTGNDGGTGMPTNPAPPPTTNPGTGNGSGSSGAQ